MPLIAVLFAPDTSLALPAEVRVGGLSVLERQIRQARRLGATPVVVGGTPPAGTLGAADAAAVVGLLAEGDVLVVTVGVVLDERIIRAVAAAAAPAVATAAVGGPVVGVERIDATTIAAGIGVFPVAMVREVALFLGDWDLAATLLRTALADPATRRLDVAVLPLDVPDLRRDVPLIWAQPAGFDAARAVTADLLAAAQTGNLDWFSRYLHSPIEDGVVRLLLPTSIAPDFVTAAHLAVALAAVVAFATGWLWTGLALAVGYGVVERVDRKLAQVRLEARRLTKVDKIRDEVVEYGWCVAFAAHFAGLGLPGAWSLAALLIGFALADSLQRAFFRRISGRHLDDAGRFERAFGLVAATRSTRVWTLLAFAAAGAWYTGFAAVAGYTVATFFVGQHCLFKQLGTNHPSHPPTAQSPGYRAGT